MESGGGEEWLVGKKRKSAEADMAPGRREPRRGLGVAALESLRAQLETVGGIYVYPAPPQPTTTTPVSLPASMPLVPGVRFNPYVGTGAVQRDYCYPQYYYGPQHYGLPSRYLQQLQASNAYALPRHQNHQAGQHDIAAIGMAAPLLEDDKQDHRRGEEQADGQTKPVEIVDLVDSDDEDEDHSAQEGLDLELRL